ncbi:MAG: DUF4258 domain-containing protein [Candidatus Omnitrophota bacterium]|nr:DUF4258 domain-containing protein [Candidatus Omnitrophota bacterium]
MINFVRIIFTTHAAIRMRQRSITAKELKAALDSPDSTSGAFQGRTSVKKKLLRGTLEVIYRGHGAETIVITCYWIKEG